MSRTDIYIPDRGNMPVDAKYFNFLGEQIMPFLKPFII